MLSSAVHLSGHTVKKCVDSMCMYHVCTMYVLCMYYDV